MNAGIETALRSACADVGIVYRDVPPDGQWHPTDVDGDPRGKGDARIKLFPDGDGGIVANWKGETRPFFVSARKPSTAEIAARERKLHEADAERERLQVCARDRTTGILDAAHGDPATHPYALTKRVPLGPLVKRGPWPQRDWTDALLVPIYQPDGRVWTIEAINVDGERNNLKDGRKRGGFHPFGKIVGASKVLIGEGIATVAAGVASDGSPGVAAMNAGNLLAVATWVGQVAASGADIVILADNDVRDDGSPNTGVEAARKAAAAVGGRVAIPEMDGLKCDFWDVWDKQGREAVERAIADAKAPEVPTPDEKNAAAVAPGLRVLTLAEFLAETIPPREEILAPWLLSQSLSMIFSWRGVGKTFVALNIAYAVATGGEFLSWKATKARKVLYLDGEMAAAELQERLRGIVLADERDFDPEYLRIVTPDLQPGPMPDLATAEGQASIKEIVADAELIIVDNISTLVRHAGRENDAESWNEVGTWALRMRQRGLSVLFLHHSGKGGAQRGSSKKEDSLDAVVCLRHPVDYCPEQGARFEVHFEKARNGGGQKLKPFEATLITDSAGKPLWTFRSVEESTFTRVVGLAVDGLSQKEIAEELEINKSNVSRHIRKAREMQMLPKEGK